MAALQPEKLTRWGEIQVGRGSDIRSYDGAGKCFFFTPIVEHGWLYALDVEERQQDCCGFVSSVLGAAGFTSWVEVEVVAKLINIPAHLVLRQFKAGRKLAILKAHRIEVLRLDTNTHWIAVGRSPSRLKN